MNTPSERDTSHTQPVPRPLLTAGMVITDRYRLLRRIGNGAMGEVWAALNIFTNREVALKFISAPGDDLRRRLEREARACGALRHKNVIDIYDLVHTDHGDPVLVLQLLEGETLSALLHRRRRLEPALAALIGRDIAVALAAIHALNIVHRDLKPANIFLHREPDGGCPVVKVLDFGVSKRLQGAPTLGTATGHAIGSVPFMSPEQIRIPSAVDSRADLWALGVVLFEMLTGHRPFQGEISALLMQILQGEIPRVSGFVRHVDPGLVEIVAGCLCRDREHRLGPAERIAEALDRLVVAGDPWSLPTPAVPSSAWSRPTSLSGTGTLALGVESDNNITPFRADMRATPPPPSSSEEGRGHVDEDELKTRKFLAPMLVAPSLRASSAPSLRASPAPSLRALCPMAWPASSPPSTTMPMQRVLDASATPSLSQVNPPSVPVASSPRRPILFFAAAAGLLVAGIGGAGILHALLGPPPTIEHQLLRFKLPIPPPPRPSAPAGRYEHQERPLSPQGALQGAALSAPPPMPSRTRASEQPPSAPNPSAAASSGRCQGLRFLERRRCLNGKLSHP